MRALVFAIALCFVFELNDARFLEKRCISPGQAKPKPYVKILNGKDAPRVPWMAGIFDEERFLCGGTLITSRKYFLTHLLLLFFELHKFYFYRVCSDGRSLQKRCTDVSDGNIFFHKSNLFARLSYIALKILRKVKESFIKIVISLRLTRSLYESFP